MTTLKRAEIDLREKIAAEIMEAAAKSDGQLRVSHAVGIVRAPINHNSICPCSLCDKWEIKSCTDSCSKHRRITIQEATRFAEIQYVNPTDEFTCDWCNHGQNEWKITELLFDIENEFPITPCCHTEATEALDIPEPDDDQRREDEESYRYSVVGR
jgi:hypothetical protein